MKKTGLGCVVVLLTLIFCFNLQAQSSAHWPQWRGPFFNGMARGDAPSVWSDTTNIKWKTEIPGRGFSTPAIWGDRIFVTTAIPTGSGAGTVVEQRFEVLSLDRKTGKIIWQKTARTAMPHEGYHRAYGSFASNSPVTDGKYVYASLVRAGSMLTTSTAN
jgi:outer membrane protein assembly factor BamB